VESKELIKAKISFKDAKVLVAEDNLINQKVTTSLLNKLNIKPDVVVNGLKAYEACLEKDYHLILMDVQMPEMDGFMATETIREMEVSSGTHIPILAMTAFAMKGDKEKCLAAGMDHYITKPINPQELYSIVEKYVYS